MELEQEISNLWVAGSSPVGGSILKRIEQRGHPIRWVSESIEESDML